VLKLKSLYGLTKPYNFERALPFVTAIFFLFLISCVMWVYVFSGKLNWGTYRLAYFLYLESTVLVAAALSLAPRYAWLLIALCCIELSLGLGTSALGRMQIPATTLLPSNFGYEVPEFRYHVLLQAVPTPNFSQSLPLSIQHDSYGLRGAERVQKRLKQQIVIATLGGSTTYGLGVANGETWPDVLERKLGDEYAVLNHGVTGYSTEENLIQTLFYLNSYDVTPKCAVYYEGWNDLQNAYLPNLDPAFADFHLLSEVEDLQVRKTPLVAKISPLGNIVIRYLQAWLETIPRPEDFSHWAPGRGSDIRLEKIFRSNLEAIAAINGSRGITSIFVGQVMNRVKLRGATRSKWVPLVQDSDVWPLQEHFNAILKRTAEAVGSPEFIPPIDEFQDADFWDRGHFSPQGAEKFATMLAPIVRANCKKN
jgi:lysophospholipase L1-like esterase